MTQEPSNLPPEQRTLRSLLPQKITPTVAVLIALAVAGSSACSYYLSTVYDSWQQETQIDHRYQEWKQRLSPEQKAWEDAIKISMDGVFWKRYKRDRVEGRTTSWDYGFVDPRKPTVLIIGDSISLGYTDLVRQTLTTRANILRIPTNGGKTANGVAHLNDWLNRKPYNIIYFNFGIHDRKTAPEVYQSNLEQIVKGLKATGAKLIFATSTPLPLKPQEQMDDNDIQQKNTIARQIMQKNGVLVDDLYTVIKADLAQYQEPNDCHLTNNGYKALGLHVAQTIAKNLPAKKSEPLAKH